MIFFGREEQNLFASMLLVMISNKVCHYNEDNHVYQV